ncbi:MAG: sulfatase, partial [Flavobacteriales bacterium]|nr:sulfatase [Flavobacteriales bacterium]
MNFIKSILVLFIISLSVQTSVSAQRKNVLLIVVDDLNTDQASFGNSAVHTPNIDALAQEGIQFTNTQCSWPVCGASRASFTTGTYPETNGVMNLSTELRDVSPNIVTIPQYLKEIGYTSEAVGKIYDPRCIDDAYDYPTSWSTPYNKNYTYPEEYGPFVKGQYRVPFPANYTKGPSTEKGPDGVLDDGYSDGQIALDAVNRLNNYKNSSKPFFLAVGFRKPHTPFISPKKYWDMYDINNIDISSFQALPVGTTEIAMNNDNSEIKGYDDVRLLTSDQTKGGDFTSSVTIDGQTFNKVLQENKQKELIMGYYATVSYIDAQIGIVMKALEDNGLKDNTLVIFTSDHGFTLGDNGMWAKHNILNNTSNVPFIIVDPNRGAGIEPRAVQLIDIFPTICDWLNIKDLEQFQGNSMLS